MTDFTERLLMILAFDISFIANTFLSFVTTHQTFPKPPLPMQSLYWKFSLYCAMYVVLNKQENFAYIKCLFQRLY